MERKLPRNFFGKLGYTSRGCPLFWKFWTILFHSLLEVAENLNRKFRLNGKCFWFRGGSRIFLGGGALPLHFNTNKPHSFFCFSQNTSCIQRKPQVISGGGGGAHPLHPPPRSAPVVYEVVWTFHPRLRAVSLFSVVRRAKRETRKWPRALPPSFRASFLAASPLPRACIALTKSEEKERLLAVYSTRDLKLLWPPVIVSA